MYANFSCTISLTVMYHSIKHDCCNRCHAVCTRAGEDCSLLYFDFNQLKDGKTQEVSQDEREVSIEDTECLKEALHEVKLSLDLSSGLTLFDASGMITHGFSDSVIDSVVDNKLLWKDTQYK